MGDNELWEDDPKGYDGWLLPHESKNDDPGDPAIVAYSKFNSWWKIAKCSGIGLMISFILLVSLKNLPSERSFFSFGMLICMVVFAISASSALLKHIEFGRELDKHFNPEVDDSPGS